MKKLVVLLTLVATASAFSQGQVNFNNKLSTATPPIDGPISYAAGGPATAGKINGDAAAPAVPYQGLDFSGKYARAMLYGGATADALTLITPNVPFRPGSAAGYILPTADGGNATRTVAGVPGGSTAYFVIKAWDTGALVDKNISYETALQTIQAAGAGYFGVSPVVGPITLSTAPATPPNLVGLQGFAINWVPEPSIIGLGILGAVAGMVVFRRRQ